MMAVGVANRATFLRSPFTTMTLTATRVVWVRKRAVGLELTGLCILVFGDLVPIDCAAGVGAVVTDSDHTFGSVGATPTCVMTVFTRWMPSAASVMVTVTSVEEVLSSSVTVRRTTYSPPLSTRSLASLLVRIADHGIAALGLTDQLPVEARDALIQRVDRGFGLEIGNGRISDNGVPVAELIVGARRSGRFADNESFRPSWTSRRR